MTAPRRIYLEPEPGSGDGDLLWCEHDDPASTGEPWTEYVRADLVQPARTDAQAVSEYTDEQLTSLACEGARDCSCSVGAILHEALRSRKAERAAVAWQRSMLDELHGILPPSMVWDGDPKRLAELLSMDGGKADRLAREYRR